MSVREEGSAAKPGALGEPCPVASGAYRVIRCTDSASPFYETIMFRQGTDTPGGWEDVTEWYLNRGRTDAHP